MKKIDTNNHSNSYTVKLLTNKDTLSIHNIWRECFTQDIDYINDFINYCFPHSTTWGIFTNSSEAVAMLSLLPSYAIIVNSTEISSNIKGAYVYGVGTLKNYRGRGYSRILMNEALKYATTNSLDYVLVKPAEESLFDLYEKQSFNKTLWNFKIEFALTDMRKARAYQPFESSKIHKSIEKNKTQNGIEFKNNLVKLRESISATNFLWPHEILEYSLMEIESRDGGTYFINHSTHQHASSTKESPTLFYSGYPKEENAQLIKVIDHNIKTAYELECVITDIATHFPLASRVIIEFPITTKKNVFTAYTSKPTISRNSLIKILTINEEVKKKLLNMYLTHSME